MSSGGESVGELDSYMKARDDKLIAIQTEGAAVADLRPKSGIGAE